MRDDRGKLDFVFDFGESQNEHAGRLLSDFANQSDSDAAEREIVGASMNDVFASVMNDDKFHAQVEMMALKSSAAVAGSSSHFSSMPRNRSSAQRACSATFVFSSSAMRSSCGTNRWSPLLPMAIAAFRRSPLSFVRLTGEPRKTLRNSSPFIS